MLGTSYAKLSQNLDMLRHLLATGDRLLSLKSIPSMQSGVWISTLLTRPQRTLVSGEARTPRPNPPEDVRPTEAAAIRSFECPPRGRNPAGREESDFSGKPGHTTAPPGARACPSNSIFGCSLVALCASDDRRGDVPAISPCSLHDDDQYFLPEHGPCLVDVIVAVDDAFRITTVRVHRCGALLDSRSPATFINISALGNITTQGSPQSYVW